MKKFPLTPPPKISLQHSKMLVKASLAVTMENSNSIPDNLALGIKRNAASVMRDTAGERQAGILQVA